MSIGGQQPSAPQTPFSPNYRERRSVRQPTASNAYAQRPGQQPNPQQPAQQLPPPQQGNMQYGGGGYSTPFGGYGGSFANYSTPFGGYGGSFANYSTPFGGYGGFQQPFAPPQPPPGMEPNPDYKPSNRYTDDVRISDMQYRPIQRANPATGVMPSEPISDPNYAPISEGLPARDQFSGPMLMPAPQEQQGSFGNNFGSADDQRARELMNRSMTNPGSLTSEDKQFLQQRDLRNQNLNMMQNQQLERQRAALGFGNPYGGMYGGLGGFFGGMSGLGGFFGGGFQGIDPRAQAQMDLMNTPRGFGMFSNQRPVLGPQYQQPSAQMPLDNSNRLGLLQNLAYDHGYTGGRVSLSGFSDADIQEDLNKVTNFLKDKGVDYSDNVLQGIYQKARDKDANLAREQLERRNKMEQDWQNNPERQAAQRRIEGLMRRSNPSGFSYMNQSPFQNQRPLYSAGTFDPESFIG